MYKLFIMSVVVDIGDLNLESLICEDRRYGYIKTISDPTHPVHVFLPELEFNVREGHLIHQNHNNNNNDYLTTIHQIQQQFNLPEILDYLTHLGDQTIPVYYISDDGDVEYVLSDTNNNIFKISNRANIKAQLCVQLYVFGVLHCVIKSVVITKFYYNNTFFSDHVIHDDYVDQFLQSDLVSNDMKQRVNKHIKLQLPSIII